MRSLMCFVLLFATTTSFALSPSPVNSSDPLNQALDRLNVVFESARTPHRSIWGGILYSALSIGAVYGGLVLWTGHHSLANSIFGYAITGNMLWGTADLMYVAYADQAIARRARPAADYQKKDVLPDFFRLPRERQYRTAKDNPSLEQFLLRLDAAIEANAPVPAEALVPTPRTS